jgi:hypothetical protein
MEMLKAAARGALKAMEALGTAMAIGRSIFSVRKDMVTMGCCKWLDGMEEVEVKSLMTRRCTWWMINVYRFTR